MTKFVKDLKKISKEDVSSAGGKGASLGEMMKNKIPVPPGFVVLASAFDNRHKAAEEIEKEIMIAFKKLKAERVAVRSSATAEDSKKDSWAGGLETYLNTEKNNLIQNIKKCWASLDSSRAIFYRKKRGLLQKKILVAVVVQKMVQSEVAGVCFTVHPVAKDKNQMVIETCWGLGELLVQGKITPDTYIINKSDLRILGISKNSQSKMHVLAKRGSKTINVPKEKITKQKLSLKQIKELAGVCKKIEGFYKEPQDIEWALEKNKFYILQSRPVTTL